MKGCLSIKTQLQQQKDNDIGSTEPVRESHANIFKADFGRKSIQAFTPPNYKLLANTLANARLEWQYKTNSGIIKGAIFHSSAIRPNGESSEVILVAAVTQAPKKQRCNAFKVSLQNISVTLLPARSIGTEIIAVIAVSITATT